MGSRELCLVVVQDIFWVKIMFELLVLANSVFIVSAVGNIIDSYSRRMMAHMTLNLTLRLISNKPFQKIKLVLVTVLAIC